MSLPTEGEEYAKLIEHLRLAQECAATLSHLTGLNDRKPTSRGWLLVQENLKRMQYVVTEIAKGKLQ